MAKDDTMVMELRLRLDKAERELSKFVRKAERTAINLKGIDHRKFTQPLGKITGSVSEFQKSLDASNARVIAFSASAGVLMGVTKAFTEMARATVEVEKSLKDINVIMGASTRNLQKFGRELFNVASQTGQSFFEVSKAATEFARQGLSMEKTLQRTKDALILTRLSGMDAADSVNALTAAINSFSSSALTSTQIINRLANVDAAFAVSTNDLAEAIRRVGSSADSVNVTFNEMIAIVTSVQQTTARGGNVIGNSLKTIFTRIQRTEVINQLKRLNVEVKDMQGNMRPAMHVLQDFAKVYDTLNPQLKASTAELIGGVYQMNILKAILKDLKSGYSVYSNALDVANSSTDEAIKRNQELNKTLSALINESLQNLTQIGAEVGKITLEPLFRRILEGFNSLKKEVNVFGDIGEFLGFDKEDGKKFGGELADNILKSFGNILSGPGFVALGTIIGKLFLDFVRFLGKSVQDFANLNKNAQKQAALQEQIKATLSANPALVDSIIRKEQTREQVERKILDVLKQEIILRERIEKLSQGAGGRAQAAGFNAKINKSTGQTTLTYKGKAAGHVPNFSSMQEYLGALSGGYKPGDIKQMYLTGKGKVTYNSAEQVKKFPGMKQEAIMPPEESRAGKSYARRFEQKHGFDPYASKGFVPNLLNVLTSMRTIFDRKGKGSTGSMTNILSASREDLMKSQGVPTWLQPILGSALRPGEMVRIRTMGQLSGITGAERAPFLAGRGENAHIKGAQMEEALAKRPGNFSWKQRFAAPGGRGELAKMPVDLGTKSKTGRNYPIESKPELKTKQIGHLFLKTLYENNSTSLKQLRSRLKAKADAGDAVAGAHLDKLQSVITEQTRRRGGEISEYSAKRVNTLSDFNSEVGFDSRNAAQALRERQRGLDVFSGGFVPNFAGMKWGAAKKKKGRAVNIGSLATMLIPQPDSKVKSPVEFVWKDKKYSVPVRGYSSAKMKSGKGFEALHGDVEKSLTKVAKRYAQKIDPPLNTDIGSSEISKYYNQGAIASATGTLFEAAIDAAFNRNVDKEGTTWDVRGGTKGTTSVRRLFGNYVTKHADYKNSITKGNLNSMAKKFENERGLKKAYGFVPNFSPISDAFDTEKKMGGSPVLDYQPGLGLYVRDGNTQKGFGDVLRDHPEGLGRASKNSKKMQDLLASSGHVPNFAEGTTGLDMTVITGALGMMSFGLIDARDKFKEVSDAAEKLREDLKEVGDKEQELAKKKSEAADQTKSDMEKSKKANIEHSRAQKKATSVENKIEKAAAQNVKKKQGLKQAPTTGTKARQDYDKAVAEEVRQIKENTKLKRNNARALRKEYTEAQKRLQSSAKNKAAMDQASQASRKHSKDLADASRATRQNAAAIRKEAAAHNKNAAMTGGQVIRGANGAAIGGKVSRGGRLGRLGGAMAMPMMMAAPMIGGIGRSIAGENQTAQGLVQGGETLATFTAMGAMAGPKGAAAGAALGAIVGGAQALGVMNDPMKQLNKNLEQATESLTNFSNSSQGYLTALDSLEAAMGDPNIKEDELVKRQDAVAEAFMALPEDVKSKFDEAGASVEDIKKTFADISKDLQQRQRIAQRRKDFEGEMDEERGWFVNAVRAGGNAVTGALGYGGGAGAFQTADDVFDNSKEGQRRLKNFTEGIMREIDPKKLDSAEGMEKLQRINDLMSTMGKEMNNAELAVFTQHLEDLGVPPEYIEDMERVNKNTEDGAKAAQNLAEKLNLSKERLEKMAEAAEHTRKLKAVNDRLSKTLKELREQTLLVNVALRENVKTEKARIDMFAELNTGRNKFAIDYAMTRLDASRKGAEPFMGKVESSRLDFEINDYKRQAKQLTDTRKIITNAIQKGFGVTQEKFLTSIDKVAEELARTAKTEEDSQKILDDLSKNQALATQLAPIMNKHLQELAENPEKFSMDEARVTRLVKELEKAGASNAALIGESVRAKLFNIQSEMVNKLTILIEENQRQRLILKTQENLQKQTVMMQERLAVAGGAEGFMGGSGGFAGLSSNLDRLNTSFERFTRSFFTQNSAGILGRSAENFPGQIERGRANAQLLDFIVNNLNIRADGSGEQAAGERLGSRAFRPLIQQAVGGRVADIRSQIGEARNLARIQSGGTLNEQLAKAFDKAFEQAPQMAMEQLASQFKLQDLPENVDVMRRQQATLVALLSEQQRSITDNNRKAFIEALTHVGLTGDRVGDIQARSTTEIIKDADKNTAIIATGEAKIAEKEKEQRQKLLDAGKAQANLALSNFKQSGQIAVSQNTTVQRAAQLQAGITDNLHTTNRAGFDLVANSIMRLANLRSQARQSSMAATAALDLVEQQSKNPNAALDLQVGKTGSMGASKILGKNWKEFYAGSTLGADGLRRGTISSAAFTRKRVLPTQGGKPSPITSFEGRQLAVAERQDLIKKFGSGAYDEDFKALYDADPRGIVPVPSRRKATGPYQRKMSSGGIVDLNTLDSADFNKRMEFMRNAFLEQYVKETNAAGGGKADRTKSDEIKKRLLRLNQLQRVANTREQAVPTGQNKGAHLQKTVTRGLMLMLGGQDAKPTYSLKDSGDYSGFNLVRGKDPMSTVDLYQQYERETGGPHAAGAPAFDKWASGKMEAMLKDPTNFPGSKRDWVRGQIAKGNRIDPSNLSEGAPNRWSGPIGDNMKGEYGAYQQAIKVYQAKVKEASETKKIIVSNGQNVIKDYTRTLGIMTQGVDAANKLATQTEVAGDFDQKPSSRTYGTQGFDSTALENAANFSFSGANPQQIYNSIRNASFGRLDPATIYGEDRWKAMSGDEREKASNALFRRLESEMTSAPPNVRNRNALISARFRQNVTGWGGSTASRAGTKLNFGDGRYMLGLDSQGRGRARGGGSIAAAMGLTGDIYDVDTGNVKGEVLKAQQERVKELLKPGAIDAIADKQGIYDEEREALKAEVKAWQELLDFIADNSGASIERRKRMLEDQRNMEQYIEMEKLRTSKDPKQRAEYERRLEATKQAAIEESARRATTQYEQEISGISDQIAMQEAIKALDGKRVAMRDANGKKMRDAEGNIIMQEIKWNLMQEKNLRSLRNKKTQQSFERGEGNFMDSWQSFADGFTYSTEEMQLDAHNALQGVGQTFRSESVAAFSALIDGTKDAKQAFGDLFGSIGKMIQQKIIEMAVNRYIFNPIGAALGGGASGGLVTASGIQKFARGGLVEGGSGIKDDVPAMLSSGEYVIKKSSVNKYGTSFLNALNSNKMPASSSTDPQANLNSLVSHMQSDSAMGAKFNMRNAFIYDSDKPTGASSYAIDTRLSRMALTDESNPRNRIRQEKVENLFEYWASRRQELAEWKKTVDEWKSQRKKSIKRAAIMMGANMLLSSMFGQGTGYGSNGGQKQTLWDKGSKGFSNWRQERRWAKDPMNAWDSDAQGGYKKDTVPSMLMGGEYVINANAVKRHGVGFFHALNAGRLRKMADGGYVGSESTIAPEGDLRGDTGMANNITINVNIDQNGDVTSDGGQIGPERGRELAKIIENQITTTLIKEKRQGGILHN